MLHSNIRTYIYKDRIYKYNDNTQQQWSGDGAEKGRQKGRGKEVEMKLRQRERKRVGNKERREADQVRGRRVHYVHGNKNDLYVGESDIY